MSQALVLGATGHIGAHVVRALLAGGHSVRAGYRTERYLTVLDGLPVERVRLDLERPEGLREALLGCRWVFHAAGYYPSNSESRKTAVRRGEESLRRTLEEIRRAGPEKAVFTSSAAVIRALPGCPANESDVEPWPLTRWRHLYSTVKIAMEREALRAAEGGLPLVVVNPSLCIGEFDAHLFSGRAVLAFARYRLPWYADTTFNMVYTGDVGAGHVGAAERGRVGERYLLAGQNVSLKEFAGLVAREIGVPPPRWRLSYAGVYLAACGAELFARVAGREPAFTRDEACRVRGGYSLDGSKAVRELGMPQTPLREAVRRAVEWFRQQGIVRR